MRKKKKKKEEAENGVVWTKTTKTKVCPENRLLLLKTSFGEIVRYSTPEKQ